jgi:hypothetical protein
MPTFKYANQRRKTFEAVNQLLPASAITSFHDWKQKQNDAVLQAVTSFSIEDAEPLVELIPTLPPETYFDV